MVLSGHRDHYGTEGGVLMSTRAYIARESRAGVLEYVFNHANGDPHSLGRILKRNYHSKQAVMGLLEGGEIEFIHPATGKVIRSARATTSEVLPESRFYQKVCVSCVDYIYVFRKGRWEAFTTDGRDIEIP